MNEWHIKILYHANFKALVYFCWKNKSKCHFYQLKFKTVKMAFIFERSYLFGYVCSSRGTILHHYCKRFMLPECKVGMMQRIRFWWKMRDVALIIRKNSHTNSHHWNALFIGVLMTRVRAWEMKYEFYFLERNACASSRRKRDSYPSFHSEMVRVCEEKTTPMRTIFRLSVR